MHASSKVGIATTAASLTRPLEEEVAEAAGDACLEEGEQLVDGAEDAFDLLRLLGDDRGDSSGVGSRRGRRATRSSCSSRCSSSTRRRRDPANDSRRGRGGSRLPRLPLRNRRRWADGDADFEAPLLALARGEVRFIRAGVLLDELRQVVLAFHERRRSEAARDARSALRRLADEEVVREEAQLLVHGIGHLEHREAPKDAEEVLAEDLADLVDEARVGLPVHGLEERPQRLRVGVDRVDGLSCDRTKGRLAGEVLRHKGEGRCWSALRDASTQPPRAHLDGLLERRLELAEQVRDDVRIRVHDSGVEREDLALADARVAAEDDVRVHAAALVEDEELDREVVRKDVAHRVEHARDARRVSEAKRGGDVLAQALDGAGLSLGDVERLLERHHAVVVQAGEELGGRVDAVDEESAGGVWARLGDVRRLEHVREALRGRAGNTLGPSKRCTGAPRLTMSAKLEPVLSRTDQMSCIFGSAQSWRMFSLHRLMHSRRSTRARRSQKYSLRRPMSTR